MKYSIKQMREKAINIPSNAEIPSEYAKVYNDYSTENPGGRAFIMWFLDYLEGKPNILLKPEDKFPYKEEK